MRKFRSIEGQISDVIPVTSETSNYKDILSHLRAQDIQLLYLPVESKDVIEIARALQEMDWDPQGMGGDGLLTNVLAQSPEDANFHDGFLAIDLYTNALDLTPYGKKVGKIFRSRYETRNSIYPANGFDGFALLIDAMNRCNDPADSEYINSGLHNTIDLEGLMGKITIRSDGKALRPLIVNRIKGNRMDFVVKVY